MHGNWLQKKRIIRPKTFDIGTTVHRTAYVNKNKQSPSDVNQCNYFLPSFVLN